MDSSSPTLNHSVGQSKASNSLVGYLKNHMWTVLIVIVIVAVIVYMYNRRKRAGTAPAAKQEGTQVMASDEQVYEGNTGIIEKDL